MSDKKIRLLPGREKSLLRRHPWVFSGAVDWIESTPRSGETVAVCDSKGRVLGRGAYSPESQIRVRIWSFDPQEEIGEVFFRKRIQQAWEMRGELGFNDPQGGCRLIFSESDGLPGLIVDRYGSFLAAQFLSAGTEYFRDLIGKILLSLPGIRGVYDRSDVSIRKKEHLPEYSGMLCGEEPPETLEITENGLRFSVDLRHGQKTGFYFDLRPARETIRRIAREKKVLNLFSYTGGFACAALAGGAKSVLNVDSSLPALQRSEINLRLNGFDQNWENRSGDAFEVLRALVNAGEKFDLVILDPPKLIDGKSALNRGCRAYQDLARHGFKALNPGGILCNFSCSGMMDPDLFQKITAAAALEAGVSGRILHRFEQSPDHPTAIEVPETFYLKGLLSKID